VVSALVVLVLMSLTATTPRYVEAAWVPTVYTAELDGFQATPTVGSETSIGAAVCVLDRLIEPNVLISLSS